ncbi:DUF4174 domain-containing protein [Flammeovirga yaeyamensis]|uniref:DUF4174 domain-containing protein n=1 Tax=Flammeovirga yaeyamensis TaxID=367791 RepID=A0AAX1MZ25_9BACT|nr:DUF4174 domain-containing protein [Flammeovirga yaeyamensis]MBB3695949.1 hypothetical protein [Flammeovirga yaeyamensis]NMF34637.1 DUF4174 domain-containing protein [Flammeovirga yaeyamensis]QWG00534.1 DUF4174 domain-containing protein [Flammeovirga yaeyamensis]
MLQRYLQPKNRCILCFIFITCIFLFGKVEAQNLDDHQWKHRLLVIKTNTEGQDLYTQQIEEFEGEENEFEERKIKVFYVVNSSYSLSADEKASIDWEHPLLFDKRMDFEVVLIGLDGGVKLRESTFLSKKDLYDKIDSMPMRRTELRDKNVH